MVLETVGAPSLIVMAVWCPPLILMGVGASSLDLVVVAVAVVPHSPSWLLVPPVLVLVLPRLAIGAP